MNINDLGFNDELTKWLSDKQLSDFSIVALFPWTVSKYSLYSFDFQILLCKFEFQRLLRLINTNLKNF